ncbi:MULTISPECIES: hypothetical protein [Paenibacillus]|uniref:hypothetical protein n=1 Tax=Paenibacillus TaxID=44249 RepID=UPI0022B87F5F|nr:hypothetical protein [Paenibacillus caseinilyticus]MCZ8522844.1 hypothetical protein [Paenibacillus caseinilyticus]
MKRIHNICEEECKPHYGKPVVLLLRDGSEIYGTLSRISDGKLVLNEVEEAGGASNLAVAGKKSLARKKGRTAKKAGRPDASTQSLGNGPYPGPYPYTPFYPSPILLDLALIALLFVLI